MLGRYSPGVDVKIARPAPFTGDGNQSFLSWARQVSRRLIFVKYLSKNRWVPWGTLYQMKNSLLSNALPFCNSEGTNLQDRKRIFNNRQARARRVVENADTGEISIQQLKRKWENLTAKYKDLRKPQSGVGTEDGKATAASWKWYSEMDGILGQKPSISPPVVISSSGLVAAVTTPSSIVVPVRCCHKRPSSNGSSQDRTCIIPSPCLNDPLTCRTIIVIATPMVILHNVWLNKVLGMSNYPPENAHNSHACPGYHVEDRGPWDVESPRHHWISCSMGKPIKKY
ncbi:unnamed protein product [Gadus morhua 'NCC']